MPPRFMLVVVALAGFVVAGRFVAVGNGAEVSPAPVATVPDAAGLAFFEQHIRPLLVARCYQCHSADAKEIEGSLRLDSRQGWSSGGDSGPSIVPGDPDKSLIMRAVRYADSDLQMPPKSKLPAGEIELLAKWISLGAPDPRDGAAAKRDVKPIDVQAGKSFWAFQPPTRPAVPAVKDTAWVRSDVDRFILAALEDKGIRPAAPADRRVLIRRVYFDLIGLPPTPEQVDAFVVDPSPESLAKVVDQLLDSPAYGERWGRHWLDVARYSDSNGLDENVAFGNAWRYRDYVTNAFCQDKPYDRFIVEQIAGDLLPSDDVALRHERLIATGFLSLGPKVLAEPDKTKMEMDVIDEQIDTLGKAVLGLTLGCARCHDHKFDPLPTSDYYALAGIFHSTQTMEKPIKHVAVSRWFENSLASPAEDKLAAQLQAHIAALKDATKGVDDEHKKALKSQIEDLEKSSPVLPSALGVAETEVTNLRVHRRGSHLTLGDEVPRGFVTVLLDGPVSLPEKQSGRLELAQWLVEKDHPLTSRVMVNRIWRWHFGQGLVATTDNFGLQGERPTNQPLLDWLAHYFTDHDWSIKAMHRLIILSSVYQSSSTFDAASAKVDPENRLHWRMNLQRLEAEEIRDAMLAVAGTLDRTVGGDSCKLTNRKWIFDHTSKDETGYDSRRRSIYLPVIRNHVYDFFQQFDFPEPSVINGNRPTTTVAPQALLLLNSPLVMQSAEQFAERLLQEPNRDDGERVDWAYRLAYGRPATPAEIDRALAFVRQFADRAVGPEAPAATSTEKTSTGGAIRLAWSALAQVILCGNEFVYLR
jgi:cytochrome c553